MKRHYGTLSFIVSLHYLVQKNVEQSCQMRDHEKVDCVLSIYIIEVVFTLYGVKFVCKFHALGERLLQRIEKL